MLKILNDKELRDNEINDLNTKQAELLDQAMKEKNLKKRFNLYNKARVLRRIAEECLKWETFTTGF
ncbi:MAG: hypothetical protein J5601_04260 [Elusimicrobiaceae bacterium]|nr:hypothetical protein [Elusimicrobiaceae bacterium]